MLGAYYALPQRFRWALLLAGSYFFYMCWNAAYALLLLFSTVVTYGCALGVGAAKSARARKGWVVLSLVLNLGILFFFKYYGLFAGTVSALRARACRGWMCFCRWAFRFIPSRPSAIP